MSDAPATRPRFLCTLSGGYDSAWTLLWCLEQGPTLALFVNYDQPYLEQEWKALTYLQARVEDHPEYLGLQEVRAPLTVYAGEPWIPYRNLVIGALACNYAVGHGASHVVFGSKSLVHRPEDPISYLDSTQAFYHDLETLILRYTEAEHRRVMPRLLAPAMGIHKQTILRDLVQKGIDLRKLWNCYRTDGGAKPCGVCPHCKETQPLVEAVEAANVGLT